jgi:polyisoprenyl-phosphate glycosyltransferase
MSDETQAGRRRLSVVVPFFNESASVEYFFDAIVAVASRLPTIDFEFVCVDDGSKDDTLARLLVLMQRDSRVRVIELSRNFGKEAALTAGIDAAVGDAVVPIDADLQDPPDLIPTLIDEWTKGAEMVLARRADRSTDSLLKSKSAQWFYRLHNKLAYIQVPENVGDFRLMDRSVVDALKQLPERQRFMKGLFAWVGFKTVSIEYTRAPRAAGQSTFSGWRLWNFALEGITSFSTAPLRMWTYIGGFGAVFSIVYAAFILVRALVRGVDLPGYPSLLVSILFFGSLQLIGIGVLGEYIGRIYIEAKHRPTYIVRRTYHSPG